MINITPAPFDNALEIEIQGKLEKEDLHHFEEFFMLKKQEHRKVNILLSIENMEEMTIKGILEDLKMTQYLKDIHKMAIVSDKKWIELGVKFDGLLPETELEHFSPEDKSQAQRWLGT